LAHPRPEQAGPRSTPAPERHAYGWFVAGLGSWFGAWGMQHVLFSWLVVGELRENPASVGLAQMFQMLPALGLMLFGGAIGDRLDRRRILLAAHAAAALAALAMSHIVANGQLTYGIVIAYAVCWGTFQSFVLPARDAMLPDVAGSDLERGVTGMTLIQFSAQAVGSAAVRGAGVIGSAAALGVQAAVAALGLYPVSKLRLAPPHGHRTARPPILREIREGLREVWQSRALRPLAGLVACNGVFFVGPYFVLYPLIVRDVYGADLGDLALVMMMFPVGMIAGSSLLLRRGGIRRKGRALLLGFVGGGLALIATSLGLPFWGLLASVFGPYAQDDEYGSRTINPMAGQRQRHEQADGDAQYGEPERFQLQLNQDGRRFHADRHQHAEFPRALEDGHHERVDHAERHDHRDQRKEHVSTDGFHLDGLLGFRHQRPPAQRPPAFTRTEVASHCFAHGDTFSDDQQRVHLVIGHLPA